MKKITTTTGLVKNFNDITVDEVKLSDYPKVVNGVEYPVHQAQIRQVVSTEYPGARVGNSLSDNLFATEDFNLPSTTYDSTRVTWIPVPEGTTPEQVEKLLAANPEATIYGIYSNNVKDVMTDEQKYSVSSGQRDLAFFEDKLRIKDGEGNELDGHDEEGKAQYRQYGFSKTFKEDIDHRTFKGSNARDNGLSNAEKEVISTVLNADATQDVI